MEDNSSYTLRLLQDNPEEHARKITEELVAAAGGKDRVETEMKKSPNGEAYLVVYITQKED